MNLNPILWLHPRMLEKSGSHSCSLYVRVALVVDFNELAISYL
jgi:hypothetical protein